ncbi:type 1 glutamine amidotransferase domain-containing protein [Microvirga lenta]|uniref:type 1 glutamine amidotransferase domain-containing protein n=1 Tax=Microvirga lenta TaxID=2881337 RepID=UPI001CFF6465|nr:type 1 glutamine amidotransferase domain-containing protein [Microvirga lenta]MCB5177202.1 type 1 glutamine amidotransferase domain-containing protein [Microvirga lenta]
MPAPKVLIVATSHDRLGSAGHRTGVWLEELATPYYTLLDGGAEITLVSIKGGAIPWDPRSLPAEAGEGPGEKPEEQQEVPASVHRFLEDEQVMQLARNSPALGSVDAASFDAVFLPGGHGPMWDAANDETLARLIGTMFDQGKVVAAVCHGPAGLVQAKRQDGRPIVEGLRVSAFTNTEEEAVGLTTVVPFLLEDRLKELGGRFERGPDWQPFAVQDRNLITGQNPQSSELVARHVLTAVERDTRG